MSDKPTSGQTPTRRSESSPAPLFAIYPRLYATANTERKNASTTAHNADKARMSNTGTSHTSNSAARALVIHSGRQARVPSG